jgi:hypothetical protein
MEETALMKAVGSILAVGQEAKKEILDNKFHEVNNDLDEEALRRQ